MPSLIAEAVEAISNNPDAMQGLSVALALGGASYVLSAVTGNDSWVDRMWSVVPVAYSWLYVAQERGAAAPSTAAIDSPWVTARALFALCATVWGTRLSFNFWRRGGYSKGGEDYRWEEIRKWPVFRYRVVWHLFSFGFISMTQQLLLFATTLPFVVGIPRHAAVGATDAVCAAGFLFFVLVEATADQQQWIFQQSKYRLMPRRPHLAPDYQRGFLRQGLFRFSRHPNVMSEQCIWMCAFLAAAMRVWPSGGSVLAAGSGYGVLFALTLRAAVFTEEISSRKYSEYARYQREVPMLYPFLKW